jgi:hypothetical protein
LCSLADEAMRCILHPDRCIRIGWLWFPVALLLALIAAPFFALNLMTSKHCANNDCGPQLCGPQTSTLPQLCHSAVLCASVTFGFPLAFLMVFFHWEPLETLGL